MENNKTFCQRVIESCEKHSAKTAMRIVGDDSEVYSYGELLKQVRSVAFRISEEKIEFGDRVALIGENHPCWAIAYLGTLFRGAVCVPIDPHGEIETITNFLENSEAKLAFLSPDVTEKFQQIEEKLGRHIPAVVWRDGEEEKRRRGEEEKLETWNLEPGINQKRFSRFDDWAIPNFPIICKNRKRPQKTKTPRF